MEDKMWSIVEADDALQDKLLKKIPQRQTFTGPSVKLSR